MSNEVDIGEVLKKIFDLVADLICELPDEAQISVMIPVKPDCGIEVAFKRV